MMSAPMVETITFKVPASMIDRVEKQLKRDDPEVPMSRSHLARLALTAYLRQVEAEDARKDRA